MDRTDDLESEGWRFALALYAQPGVSDACLQLQDRADIDVNMLLYTVFTAVTRGLVLDTAALKQIHDAVADWRRHVIGPLRHLRRGLKSGSLADFHAGSQALRDTVKACELAAEQIEFAAIAGLLKLPAGSGPGSSATVGAALHELVRFQTTQNGSDAGAFDGLGSDELQGAIDTIVAATQSPH